MANTANTYSVSFKAIKACKKFTATQRQVLAEVHSLISRNMEFFEWNSTLAEKLGYSRSGVANAITYFYKMGILARTKEYDLNTKHVRKRTLHINYKRLAEVMGAQEKSDSKTPLEPQKPSTKEMPQSTITSFDDIDFTLPESKIIDQWVSYMCHYLTLETGMFFPTDREKNSLRKILADALFYSIDSLNDKKTKTDLIKDQRLEVAIKITLNMIRYDMDHPEINEKFYSPENLNFTYIRNVFNSFNSVVTISMQSPTWQDAVEAIKHHEDFYLYFYDTETQAETNVAKLY